MINRRRKLHRLTRNQLKSSELLFADTARKLGETNSTKDLFFPIYISRVQRELDEDSSNIANTPLKSSSSLPDVVIETLEKDPNEPDDVLGNKSLLKQVKQIIFLNTSHFHFCR